MPKPSSKLTPVSLPDAFQSAFAAARSFARLGKRTRVTSIATTIGRLCWRRARRSRALIGNGRNGTSKATLFVTAAVARLWASKLELRPRRGRRHEEQRGDRQNRRRASRELRPTTLARRDALSRNGTCLCGRGSRADDRTRSRAWRRESGARYDRAYRHERTDGCRDSGRTSSFEA